MTEKTDTHQKLGYLDSLRGLAALIVVFTHFCGAFYPYAIFAQNYPKKSQLETLFHQTPLGLLVAGNFAVCLFFILSGYVLSYRYIGRQNTRARVVAAMIKRPIRLGGMVLFTIAASYFVMLSGQYWNNETAALSGSDPWFRNYWKNCPRAYQFFLDLIVRPYWRGSLYNPPLWTITIELYGSYLVYGFLLILGNSRYRLSALLILSWLFRETYYLGFLVGIICAEVEHSKIQASLSRSRWPVAGLVAGLLLGSAPAYVGSSDYSGSAYGMLPTIVRSTNQGGAGMIGAILSFCCLLIVPRAQKWLSHPVLLYLGKISFQIYAIHFIVLGSITSLVFVKLTPHMGYTLSSFIALTCLITILIPVSDFTNRLIDEPTVKFSNRVGKWIEIWIRKSNSLI